MNSISAMAMPPDYRAINLQTGRGEMINERYRGYVVLVVNTPAYCDGAKQFRALQALYQRYRDDGLVVLGFPSTDFDRKKHHNNEALLRDCKRHNSLSFPFFAPSHVTGKDANALFRWFHQETDSYPDNDFTKYLINREGELVKTYGNTVRPDALKLSVEILRLLGNKSVTSEGR